MLLIRHTFFSWIRFRSSSIWRLSASRCRFSSSSCLRSSSSCFFLSSIFWFSFSASWIRNRVSRCRLIQTHFEPCPNASIGPSLLRPDSNYRMMSAKIRTSSIYSTAMKKLQLPASFVFCFPIFFFSSNRPRTRPITNGIKTQQKPLCLACPHVDMDRAGLRDAGRFSVMISPRPFILSGQSFRSVYIHPPAAAVAI